MVTDLRRVRLILPLVFAIHDDAALGVVLAVPAVVAAHALGGLAALP